MRNWTILFLILVVGFFSVGCTHTPVASLKPDVVPDTSVFRWVSSESDKLGYNGEDVLVCVEPGTSRVILGGSYLSTVYLNLFKVEPSGVVAAEPLSAQDGKFETPLEYQLIDSRKLTLKMDPPQEGVDGINKRPAFFHFEGDQAKPLNCYEQVADDSFRIKMKRMVTGPLSADPE